MGGQSTFSEVSKPLLKKIPISPSPLPEQRRIAEVLGTMDSAIERTERLKRGLMQRLLTEGIGHERFKETKVGKVPDKWEIKALGPSIDLLTGYPFKSKEFLDESSDLRLVRRINVTTGALRWRKELTKYWGEITDDLKKYQICENDLLIGMDGAKVGKNFAMVKVNDLPALLVQRVSRIRTKKELDQRYLYYAIGSHLFVNYVGRVNTSSGIAHISEKQIKDFKIPFPSLPEQRHIAEILSTVDKKLELERHRKEKLERIKKGLMNELLTGRKRVR